MELDVVAHLHNSLTRNSPSVTMSKSLVAYIRLVKTVRSRFEGKLKFHSIKTQ